jgi:hypothetical protein
LIVYPFTSGTGRTHKLATVEKILVQRLFGQIAAVDRPQVAAMLQSLLAGW